MIVINNLSTLHAESTVLSTCTEVYDPALEVVVWHRLTCVFEELPEHVLDILDQLDVKTVLVAAVNTLLLQVELGDGRGLDSENMNEPHSDEPVLCNSCG